MFYFSFGFSIIIEWTRAIINSKVPYTHHNKKFLPFFPAIIAGISPKIIQNKIKPPDILYFSYYIII